MPVGWQYDATVMWGGVAGTSSAFGRRGALHDRDDPEAQIDEDGGGNVWERSRQSDGSVKQDSREPKNNKHERRARLKRWRK